MSAATLERKANRILVRTPYSDELRDLCGALPAARFDKGERAWHVPATLVSAENAHELVTGRVGVEFDAVNITPTVQEILDRAAASRDAAKYRTMPVHELPPVPSGSEYEPWEQQARMFHYGLPQEGMLFEMVMGAGKSKGIVDLINAWHARHVLIVCPKNVRRVWPREFRKHSHTVYRLTEGRPFKRDGKPKLTASLVERVRQLDEHEFFAHERVAVIVNYETIWREPMASFLLSRRWHVCVLDECHRAQAPGGKASRFLDKLRDQCDRRIGATGTLGDTGLAAYGYCRFLDPGLFGTSVSKFRRRWGKPRVKYMSKDIDADGELVLTPVYHTIGDSDEPIYDGVRDDLADEFAARLARITYSCGDEVIDLDKPVDHVVPVELSGKARRVYDDLEREYVAEIGSGEFVVADSALVKMLRLQQIASGFVPVETGLGDELFDIEGDGVYVGNELRDGESRVRIEHIDTAKEDALVDWLADIEHPHVVVFARFRHDLESIARAAERAGRKYGELSGRRDTLLDDEACMRADVELGGVQIDSGGVGVDLTRARYGVYYSRGVKLVPYEQSRSRLWRPGQQRELPVEFVHLVAEGTTDEDSVEALNAKKGDLQYLLDRMRGRMKGGR